MGNRIYFSNAVLKNKNRIKGEPKLYYILSKYKKKGSYDILYYMSEHVALFKLMDYLGNVNNATSIFWYWIFDSNHKIALVLNRESLDMICAPSVVKEQVAKFGTLFTAVRYIFSTVHLNKD